ncbi:MAG: hypothetical protein DRP09_16075 [Candidatus Thorarchaeota archaeon]|nr:MAG: hypothetical protein DRP09_16075 [Candidatus Thorarchaeota archaeon]
MIQATHTRLQTTFNHLINILVSPRLVTLAVLDLVTHLQVVVIPIAVHDIIIHVSGIKHRSPPLPAEEIYGLIVTQQLRNVYIGIEMGLGAVQR